MPYGGDTPSQTKKIERCVDSLLKNPDFRKGQKPETRKDSAIAICKTQIMKQDKKLDVKEKKYKVIAENVPVFITGTFMKEDVEDGS